MEEFKSKRDKVNKKNLKKYYKRIDEYGIDELSYINFEKEEFLEEITDIIDTELLRKEYIVFGQVHKIERVPEVSTNAIIENPFNNAKTGEIISFESEGINYNLCYKNYKNIVIDSCIKDLSKFFKGIYSKEQIFNMLNERIDHIIEVPNMHKLSTKSNLVGFYMSYYNVVALKDISKKEVMIHELLHVITENEERFIYKDSLNIKSNELMEGFNELANLLCSNKKSYLGMIPAKKIIETNNVSYKKSVLIAQSINYIYKKIFNKSLMELYLKGETLNDKIIDIYDEYYKKLFEDKNINTSKIRKLSTRSAYLLLENINSMSSKKIDLLEKVDKELWNICKKMLDDNDLMQYELNYSSMSRELIFLETIFGTIEKPIELKFKELEEKFDIKVKNLLNNF